jgi:hypothetical protein
MNMGWKLSFFLSAAMLPGSNAIASVVAIGPFSPMTTITFTGLANGTEVNGLTVSGVLFSYSLGNGMVAIDGGPGVTNNINPPNIEGNSTGTLTMSLSSPATMFGYGYAIFNTVPVSNAITMSVFRGATPLGTLPYAGVPDPVFTGGFAGIQSTTEFDRVAVSFNAASNGAFALDNILIAVAPEPSMLLPLMFGSIIAGFVCHRPRIRFFKA